MTLPEPDEELQQIFRNVRPSRILVYGLACVMLLIVISGGLNWAYYSFASSDNFLEIHDVHVTDSTDHAESLEATIDRTVHAHGVANADITLFRVYEDGSRRAVAHWDRHPYLESGRHTIHVTYPLDNKTSLESGRYYLVVEYRLHLQKDVTRSFVGHSNTFNVTATRAL